jgi:hypothetical protein
MHSFSVFAFILAFFTLLLTGCEQSKLGTVDVSTDIPFVTQATVSPDSIFIDSLTPQSGQYPISAIVSVRVISPGSRPTVTATVVRPNGSDVVAQFTLRDDGASPDQIASDSIYTAQIQFTVERAQAGRYRIRFQATTSSTVVSNVLERSLKLGRRNSAPILRSVSIPDSISVPLSDTIRVQFTATVSDSDGLADIREMAFQRISPPDPTKFFMKDDGGLEPPVNVGGIPVRSGDDVAGDGRYSFLIPITPTATRRTNVFLFQAVDSFGDTSRSIIDSLIVR